MRAVCESCERPQPIDWKAGDLCIHCGKAARHEVRCFWCAKWTPAGKFCKRCGASVVDERHYGAARMLKDAGADRFTIPKMLVELDPDQIDNLTQIYQRHAAAVLRHVEHLRFLELFLYHRHWSEALHEELTAQLPWPEERLEAMTPPVNPVERSAHGARVRGEQIAVAKAIQSVTPFPVTRAIAALVRFRLDDWTAHAEARNLLSAGSPELQAEAVLAVTSWRALFGPCERGDRWPLIEALRLCPFPEPSLVRRAMLGDDSAVVSPEALTSDDPDVAFSAAIVLNDIDRMSAAAMAPDPLQQFAAASKLIRLGAFGPVREVLRSATPEYQLQLLREVELRRKPSPALRDVLFEIVDNSGDPAIRKYASFCLCYGCRPEDGLRLARAANGDRSIYQALLQRAGLPPETLEQFGGFLIDRGEFSADQWGMDAIAKEGQMPAGFVLKFWTNAGDATRIELCGFAEKQLEAYADEGLHRFLVSVVFGEAAVEVEHAAWTSLFRWYGRSDHSGMGPLLIQSEALHRFFGSPAHFVSAFTRFLRRKDLLEITASHSNYERLAKFLRYADDDVLPELAQLERPVKDLVGATSAMMSNQNFDFMLRLAGANFLGFLGRVPVFREVVEASLSTFLGTDLDLASKEAIARAVR